MTTRRTSARTVRIALGTGAHDARIGAGAIRGIGRWLPRGTSPRSRRAFIIADERLVDARRALVESLRVSGWETTEIPVTAGELLKDIESVYPIYGKLLEAKASRDAVLFALGGGSVGDAAGFVAATYLRGIRWVGVPTTLLAQVDSSVGGKTAINHPMGKNLIGAFHQPILVVCDTDFLKTLSSREIVSGLGETVKYGLVFDPEFHASLERDLDRLLERDPRAIARSIERSLHWKARAVARDELDQKGIREVLNFGHTFGHALEAAAGYGTYQHGEAVLWGMRFALALSEVRGTLASRERGRADRLLARLPVPALPQDFGPERFFELMQHDKKARDGKIHFVLLRKIGKAVSDNGVTFDDLSAAHALLLEGKRP